LGELVLSLIDVSRGGTIEIVPTPFLFGHCGFALGSDRVDCAPPKVESYIDSVLKIYCSRRIPLHLVSLLSWVKARFDAEIPLVSSPAEVGAEVAVLPNGDLYAGEFAVGTERWRLGNVLKDGEDLNWERLDAIPEACCRSMKPSECKSCAWRYRCGGLDASVMLLNTHHSRPIDEQSRLFQLYCEPRKALFEEALWDSVEATVLGRNRRARESLQLREDGMDFKSATAVEEVCQ
jgi:radical SAM protein with 4Fe4S-binding SPASM domain